MLLLLSVSVARRAARHGLYGGGVSLKITYADMKGLTRTRTVEHVRDAVVIYRDALELLRQIPRRSVRLIGAGLTKTEPEGERQLNFEDFQADLSAAREDELRAEFEKLSARYSFDFWENREKIFQGENMHRTVEYMRKKQAEA